MKKGESLNKKFECPICRRVGHESEDDLILHIVTIHKLANKLEIENCITKHSKLNLSTYKCVKCSQIFQSKDVFFIHLFKNHLDEALKTIRSSRLKANADAIESLFKSFRMKNPHPPIEKLNIPDVDFIFAIEFWEQGIISNVVDSGVQTDQITPPITNKIDELFGRFPRNEEEIEPKKLVSTEAESNGDGYTTKEARRIYEIDYQDFDIKRNSINSSNENDDENESDDDDDYLSFIASTIDTSNIRLQNGKTVPSIEEKKKKMKSKKSVIDERKDEERSFFDRLENEADILALQKIIINNQTQHECLKCKMNFDDDIMLMKHIWEYHNDDEIFFY